jgi:predicted amidohydrolase YtcJ
MKKTLRWAVAALVALASPVFATNLNAGDVIIRHATVVDVEHGRTIADQSVVLRGGDIMAVGADSAVASRWKARKTVEAGGRFLIPGLWDMHVHFGGDPDMVEENKALLPLYVAYGVTTIRDCSSDLSDQVLRLAPARSRRATCSGRSCSPRAPRSKACTRSGKARSRSAAGRRWTRRSRVCGTTGSIS